MNFDTKAAVASWNAEVEAEMVKLIEEGVPPYDAAGRARDIVTRRRHNKARRASESRREP